MSITPTATADREATRRMADIDLHQLADLREERWELRRGRIETDPTLDPQIRQWYLNRTPQNTRQTAVLLSVTDQRVSAQRETSVRRSVVSRHRPQPHPSIIPTMDTVEGVLAGVPDPGVELGVLIEWAAQSGRWELRVYQPGDFYVPRNTTILRVPLEPYTGDDPDEPIAITEPDTWALTNLIKEKGPQTGRVRKPRSTLPRPAPTAKIIKPRRPPSPPIEELGLANRVAKKLQAAGIHSIDDLTSQTEADLHDIRNFGQESIAEVKAKLAEQGLALPQQN